MKNNRKKGFTFVELVVVLGIIAIIGAIVVPSLINYVQNAAEEKETTEMNHFTSAVRISLSDYEALDEIETAAYDFGNDKPITIVFRPDAEGRMYVENAMVEERLLSDAMPHVFAKLTSNSVDFVEITSVAHRGMPFYVEIYNAAQHGASIEIKSYWGGEEVDVAPTPGDNEGGDDNHHGGGNDNESPDPITPPVTVTVAQIETYLCNNLFYEAHNQGSLGAQPGDICPAPHSALKANASLVNVNITVAHDGQIIGTGTATTGVPNSTLFLKVGEQYIALAVIPNKAPNPTILSINLTDRAYEAFIAAVAAESN